MTGFGQTRSSGRPLADVRITPENSRRADIGGRLKRATTGREQSQQGGPYSITSSARASSVGGTSRPSALAVIRFTTRSNLFEAGAVRLGAARRWAGGGPSVRRHASAPRAPLIRRQPWAACPGWSVVCVPQLGGVGSGGLSDCGLWFAPTQPRNLETGWYGFFLQTPPGRGLFYSREGT